MDDWQVTHIQKNLPTLLSWTNCNTQLLAILQADEVLGENDIQGIEANNEPNRKAKLLYENLKSRENAYYKLIKALMKTKQTGAAKLLLEIPTNKLSKLQVSFLGKISSVESLLNQDQIKSVQDWFQKNVTIEDFLQIHENILCQAAPLQLLRDTIPQPYPLYIPRLLSRRHVVNPKIFQEKCCDVFVFKNTKRTQLRKCVTYCAIQTSTEHLLTTKSKARLIVLDVDSDWQKICDKVNSPVHLIRYENTSQTFLVEATSGDSEILRQHLKKGDELELEDSDISENLSDDDNFSEENGENSFSDESEDNNASDNGSGNTNTSNDRTENDTSEIKPQYGDISEDQFVEIIFAENVKGVCICDSPGMGKSLLLANLAHKISTRCPDRIVVFIQLRKFVLPLQNDISPESLLFEYLATSRLSERIFIELVKSKNIKFELLFDGLDEVPENLLHTTTAFLQSITRRMPEARVFVTSRPVVRAKLEKALGVIAYDIQPFNKQTQLKFLTSHWAAYDSNTDPIKLEKYAKLCLKSVKDFFSLKEKNITGVPLQCKLIADVYTNEASIYADKNRTLTIGLSISFANSLSEIYSKYTARQLEEGRCNFECMYINSPEEPCDVICQIKNFHVWQALQLILPNFSSQLQKYICKFDTLSLEKILSPGILIENHHETTFEFFHRTFAEFLVAEFLWKGMLLQPNGNFGPIHIQQSLQQSAFNEIFTYNAEYISIENCYKYSLREGVVAYFLNSLITSNHPNVGFQCLALMSPKSNKYFRTLQACIGSNYEGLLDLFMKATENCKINCQTRNEPSKDASEEGDNLKIVHKWLTKNGKYKELRMNKQMAGWVLTDAVNNCSAKTVEKLYQFFLDVLNIDLNDYVWTPPIHAALERADYELVDFFAERMSLEEQGLIYKCVQNTWNLDAELLEKRLEIAQFLLSKCPGLLDETWSDKDHEYISPLFAKKLHLKAIKFLIENGCQLPVPNCELESVIYLICSGAWCMSDDDFFELCNYFCVECNARDYFLDPTNWKDYLEDLQNIDRELPTKTLFQILSFVGIESLFLENLASLIESEEDNLDYKKILYSLFYSAVCDENVGFADMLLTYDNSVLQLKDWFDSNPDDNIQQRMVKVMRFHKSRGGNLFHVDSQGQTILHIAAYTKNCNFFHEVVCILGELWDENQHDLVTSVSACQEEEDGQKTPKNLDELFNFPEKKHLATPLHYSLKYLKYLSLETLDLLLAGGRKLKPNAQQLYCVSINAVDCDGWTALQFALEGKRSLDFVKHLVNRGADLTMTDYRGWNVAHYCAKQGSCLLEHLKYFVDQGVSINQLTCRGFNALQCAVDCYYLGSKDRTEIIRVLIKAGADKKQRNVWGQDAYNIAADNDFPDEVLDLLL